MKDNFFCSSYFLISNHNRLSLEPFVSFHVLGDRTVERLLGLPHEAFNSHLSVWGLVGHGKSRFVYGLINQLVKKGPKVLVFDLKGEYKHVFPLDGSYLYFELASAGCPVGLNIFEIPPYAEEKDDYIQFIISLLPKRRQKVPVFRYYNREKWVDDRELELQKRIITLGRQRRQGKLAGLKEKKNRLWIRYSRLALFQIEKYREANNPEMIRFEIGLIDKKLLASSMGNTNLNHFLKKCTDNTLLELVVKNYLEVLFSSIPRPNLYSEPDFAEDMKRGRALNGWNLLQHIIKEPENELDIAAIASDLQVSTDTVKRRVKVLVKWKLVSYAKKRVLKTDAMEIALKYLKKG